MTSSNGGGAERRPEYDEQFRRDAVELWRAIGKTAKWMAQQLGIKPDRLYA